MLSRIEKIYLDEIMQIEISYNNAFVLHAQNQLYR